ncbi:MAG: hypothetical protein ACI8T1_002096 [Verrucomicrobiales bacterium]|jgi:hypothetical protein
MGPWYDNVTKTNLFPSFPGNAAILYRFHQRTNYGSGYTSPNNATNLGGQEGNGNAKDGFVFAFRYMPPAQNLLINLRVGTVAGTVISYLSMGPQGGTITISFDDSSLNAGSSVTASYSHRPRGAPFAHLETSTNTYTKP